MLEEINELLVQYELINAERSTTQKQFRQFVLLCRHCDRTGKQS